ncbi:hypothetical protein [Chitinophaga defluvii]|uniref:DUF3592 domain-containing protein n=1 Tax=Chitinophaga defluvii TaxID=3163343 RepID=A0ABV2T1K0_9BACT
MSRHLILTLILLGISILLFALSYGKYQLRIETVKEENLIDVTITDVDCYVTKSFSSLSFKHNGTGHRVNMAHNRCGQYKKGEQIKVYYNPQSDWWLLPDDGREEEELMGVYGSILMFIVVLIYMFRMIYLKKYSTKQKNRR